MKEIIFELDEKSRLRVGTSEYGNLIVSIDINEGFEHGSKGWRANEQLIVGKKRVEKFLEHMARLKGLMTLA